MVYPDVVVGVVVILGLIEVLKVIAKNACKVGMVDSVGFVVDVMGP